MSVSEAVPTQTREFPIYARREPDEWRDLLETIQTDIALDPDTGVPYDTSLTWDSALQIYVDLDEALTDNEALDENCYYGFGKVICGMARELKNPKVKQEVVSQAARNAASYILKAKMHAPSAEGGNVYREQLANLPLNDAFINLAWGASDAMPIDERYLARGLYTLHKIRRNGQIAYTEQDIKGMINGYAISMSIGTNALVGTKAILIRALDTKYPEFAHGGPILPEQLDSLSLGLSQLGPSFASLRIDEFNADIKRPESQYVVADENGDADFCKHNLPDEPPSLGENRTILHSKRLKCPALHVQAMLRTFSGILPEIITETDRLIVAKVKA